MNGKIYSSFNILEIMYHNYICALIDADISTSAQISSPSLLPLTPPTPLSTTPVLPDPAYRAHRLWSLTRLVGSRQRVLLHSAVVPDTQLLTRP